MRRTEAFLIVEYVSGRREVWNYRLKNDGTPYSKLSKDRAKFDNFPTVVNTEVGFSYG